MGGARAAVARAGPQIRASCGPVRRGGICRSGTGRGRPATSGTGRPGAHAATRASPSPSTMGQNGQPTHLREIKPLGRIEANRTPSERAASIAAELHETHLPCFQLLSHHVGRMQADFSGALLDIFRSQICITR